MRLTTKGRFAVTAMIDVAMRQHEGPVTLAGISERQRISLSYLEQLFGKLRRRRLVISTRGPGGGYQLERPMNQTTVSDIIFAVDEDASTITAYIQISYTGERDDFEGGRISEGCRQKV
jgi:Rrf2 family iron-sulfur cluster assembly transcriptional regulator